MFHHFSLFVILCVLIEVHINIMKFVSVMCTANCGLQGTRVPKSHPKKHFSALQSYTAKLTVQIWFTSTVWQSVHCIPLHLQFFLLISLDTRLFCQIGHLHFASFCCQFLRSYCVICDLVPEGEAVVVLRQDMIKTPGSA